MTALSISAPSALTPSTLTSCLVDTNVLLRDSDASSAQHLIARTALKALAGQNTHLIVAPQNLIEFWAAATRPIAVNGLGLSPSQVAASLAGFKVAFKLLPDSPAIFPQWERLTTRYAVQGKQAHDCRLVAFMLVHGITHLLTFNAAHFRRYEGTPPNSEGITVIDPASVPPVAPGISSGGTPATS